MTKFKRSEYAGGHRIRVTPVPIPNTEVKPDTADGTAWETVWESRSLPALIHNTEARCACRIEPFCLYRSWRSNTSCEWMRLSGAHRQDPRHGGCIKPRPQKLHRPRK